MPTFKLISHHTCPFVQRSVITLEAKGVPYERSFIDLANKPDWFLAISPMGKVPVLVVRPDDESAEETVLFESAVISEYLDEVTEGSMHPSDPLAKAQHRAMNELASAALGDAWRLAMAKDLETAKQHEADLRAKLARFEAQIVGPMFAGEAMNMVDASTLPLLQRVAWVEELADELDAFKELPKVKAWLKAGEAHEAVQRSTVSDVRERYQDYIRARSPWLRGA